MAWERGSFDSKYFERELKRVGRSVSPEPSFIDVIREKDQLLDNTRRQVRENAVALQAAVRTNERLRDQMERQRASLEERSDTLSYTARQSLSHELNERRKAQEQMGTWKSRYDSMVVEKERAYHENQRLQSHIKETVDRLEWDVQQATASNDELEKELARQVAAHSHVSSQLKDAEDEVLDLKQLIEEERHGRRELQNALKIQQKEYNDFKNNASQLFDKMEQQCYDLNQRCKTLTHENKLLSKECTTASHSLIQARQRYEDWRGQHLQGMEKAKLEITDMVENARIRSPHEVIKSPPRFR